MDFRKGDKVIIFKPSQDILKKWNNSWIDDMDKFIGEEMIIEDIRETLFKTTKSSWSWPLEILYNQHNQHNKESHYEIY